MMQSYAIVLSKDKESNDKDIVDVDNKIKD